MAAAALQPHGNKRSSGDVRCCLGAARGHPGPSGAASGSGFGVGGCTGICVSSQNGSHPKTGQSGPVEATAQPHRSKQFGGLGKWWQAGRFPSTGDVRVRDVVGAVVRPRADAAGIEMAVVSGPLRSASKVQGLADGKAIMRVLPSKAWESLGAPGSPATSERAVWAGSSQDEHEALRKGWFHGFGAKAPRGEPGSGSPQLHYSHMGASDPGGLCEAVHGPHETVQSLFGDRIWCRSRVQGIASVPKREVGGILNVKQREKREGGAS